LANEHTSIGGTPRNSNGVVILSGISLIVGLGLGACVVKRLLESGRARSDIGDEARSSCGVDHIQSVIFQEIQVGIISGDDLANSLERLVDHLIFSNKESNSSASSSELVDHLELEDHVICSLACVVNVDVVVKIRVKSVIIGSAEGRMTRIIVCNERREASSSRLVALKSIQIRRIGSWKIRRAWCF